MVASRLGAGTLHQVSRCLRLNFDPFENNSSTLRLLGNLVKLLRGIFVFDAQIVYERARLNKIANAYSRSRHDCLIWLMYLLFIKSESRSTETASPIDM